ncbi:hypothetical protein BJX63DRAFT_240673 [Aspergillus granulosus]|uniref:Secreted protein n=1 Tax=Aspergillus granulosus TaxID=176169 RepID=A0ABR4HAW2_9EURO
MGQCYRSPELTNLPLWLVGLFAALGHTRRHQHFSSAKQRTGSAHSNNSSSPHHRRRLLHQSLRGNKAIDYR